MRACRTLLWILAPIGILACSGDREGPTGPSAADPLTLSNGEICITPPSGMVTWWPGDGNTDDIAGANPGTLMEGASFAAGKVSQAFSFDGVDDHVVAAPYTGGPVYAFDFWFNSNTLIDSASLARYPVQFHTGGPGVYEILGFGSVALDSASEVITLEHDGTPGYGRTFVQGITLQANTWYHFAASWNGLSYDIYVNGVSQPTTKGTAPNHAQLFTDATIMRVGNSIFAGVPSRGFEGLIDEVEVFNRALTAAEIVAIYNAGSAGKCKPASCGDGTVTVTTTLDILDDTDVYCCLREAILAANASAGPNIITLPAGTYTLTTPGTGENASITGDLDVTGDLTINGVGAGATIIDGGAFDRVFHVVAGTTVAINNVRIQNGFGAAGAPPGFGDVAGGIHNSGTLTLENVLVSNNLGDGGSGIYNNGTLDVVNSSITGNTDRFFGAGIWNDGGLAILTLTGSTISNNVGRLRGTGIYNSAGTATLINSTVSGNVHGTGITNDLAGSKLTLINSTVSGNGGTATNDFGGINNSAGNVELVNSTVVGNTGTTTVGGISNGNSGTMSLKNTIIANNSPSDCVGPVTTNGHNLIEAPGSCTFGGTGTGDVLGLDPILGLLTNNGGPTLTHQPQTGSPAIDVVPASDCNLSADQRGVPRPQPLGGNCDIGSVEVENLNQLPIANAGPDQTVEATGPSGAAVTLDGSASSDPDGDTLTLTWTGPFGTIIGVSPAVMLPVGTHLVTLEVSDGQATAVDTVEIKVQDTTPPETTINSAVDGEGTAVPSGEPTLSGGMTFTFGGTDAVGVAGFECSLDGLVFTACVSPKMYTTLAIGAHTFDVRALDAAGNVDGSPANHAWTVVTPAQATENLLGDIEDMGLPGGTANSLSAPLGEASDLLNDGNTSNDGAVCNKLDAFIGQVETKINSGQLTETEGEELIAAAKAIKVSLGCSPSVGGAGLWTSVSAGGINTCGVTTAGAGYCWGHGSFGGLGNGSTSNSSLPVAVAGGLTFAFVSAGLGHSCGVTNSGAAYCWGSGANGELGTGLSSNSSAPATVAGGLIFTSVSAGHYHSCGVTSSGAAYCWGRGPLGQLGNGSWSSSSVPVVVAGGLTFASVSAGEDHTCGVTTSGVAYCWGYGNSGRLGNGSSSSSGVPVAVTGGLMFGSVSAGADHSCGLTTTGAAYCWGSGVWGRLGNGSSSSTKIPVAVAGGLTFATVTSLADHTCGVTTSGVGYCWGYGNSGRLGNGSSSNSSIPVAIAGGLTFAFVSAGNSHTCGVTISGAAYCWGFGGQGRLGNGSTSNSSVPVAVSDP